MELCDVKAVSAEDVGGSMVSCGSSMRTLQEACMLLGQAWQLTLSLQSCEGMYTPIALPS